MDLDEDLSSFPNTHVRPALSIVSLQEILYTFLPPTPRQLQICTAGIHMYKYFGGKNGKNFNFSANDFSFIYRTYNSTMRKE